MRGVKNGLKATARAAGTVTGIGIVVVATKGKYNPKKQSDLGSSRFIGR